MTENYTVINGKKYRKGYTTGSCAAAASKAAVMMLAGGNRVDRVEIDTPAGVRLNLAIVGAEISGTNAKCAVVKDGGDDPDKTSGLKIYASAEWTSGTGVRVKAAEGVGVVTLPGLKVPVGQPAINPVPMKMILKEVGEVLPEGKGVEITLSVPGGAEVAKETYNPRLGIVGGISILGTTGIVNPMSEEAWKDSLAVELGVVAARGVSKVVFTFGNYGESFAIETLSLDKGGIVKISNFLGFMLDKAVEYGMKEILLIGHLGKLVKVAAGIFHTHSRVADARMEILSAYAALEGCTAETVKKIYLCKTTEAAASILHEKGFTGVFDRIAANASRRCREYTFEKVRFGTVLFNEDNKLLSMDEDAKRMIKEFGNEQRT